MREDSGPRPALRPDAALLPYTLRAYWAWKRRLPFAFRSCNADPARCEPARSNLDRDRDAPPSGLARAQRFFQRTLPRSVQPANLRTAPGDGASDFYPVALTRPALRPGTIFTDPYGHVLWLLPASGTLTPIACAVCTLGPAFEQRVSALFAARQASLAMALDQLGNELLFAVTRRAEDRMLAEAARHKLCMAGELRPGDPGLAIDAQAAVLRLAQAENIGVRLGGGGLMHPVKSCSMVMGVGIDLPPEQWSRCAQGPTRAKSRVVERAPATTAS